MTMSDEKQEKFKRLLDLINLASSPQAFLQIEEQFAESIIQVTSAEKLYLHLVSDDNSYFELIDARNFSDSTHQRYLAQNRIPFAIAPKYFQEAVTTGNVIRIQDVFIDPRTKAEREVADVEGYRKLECYPLIVKGSVVGLLTCCYVQDVEQADDERAFIASVASLLALLIENFSTREREEELIQRLSRLTVTCEKTGLYNRRYLMENLIVEVSRAQRYNRPLSCLMFDIDGLKEINDAFGASMGDFIIAEFAELLKTASRESDIAVRYGGEEFMLIAVETTREGAIVLGERILKLIEGREFTEMNKTARATCCLGIASMPHPRLHSAEEFLREADRALLKAKEMGKSKLAAFD